MKLSVAEALAGKATGYTGDPNARQSRILPGWSVADDRRMGADAVTLLVYYHPGAKTTPEIEAFVQEVAEEYTRHDLALMLEPLSYSLDPNRKLTSSENARWSLQLHSALARLK